MKKKLSVIIAALLMLSTVLTSTACGSATTTSSKGGNGGGDAEADNNGGNTGKQAQATLSSIGKSWDDDENLPTLDEDVIDTLQNAINNTIACDNFSVEFEGKAAGNIDQQGLTASLNIPLSGYIKINGADPQNPTIGLSIDAKLPEFIGGTTDVDLYVEDGISYISYNGFTAKEEADADMSDMKNGNITLPRYLEDFIGDAKFVSRNDGSKSVTVEFGAEMISNMLKIPESYLDVDRVKLRITVKDDKLAKIEFIGELTINIPASNVASFESLGIEGFEPLPIVLGVEASATISTPSGAVSITPPTGYKDFPDAESVMNTTESDQAWDEEEYWEDEEYWDDYNYDYPAEAETDSSWNYYDYYDEAETDSSWDYYDYYDEVETTDSYDYYDYAEAPADYYWE